MKGTFEVIAYKEKKRAVCYFTVELYNGIANVIYDHMAKKGYRDISIRLI